MTIPSPATGSVFAIDVGATNIKCCLVDESGFALESVRRRRTPYPCTPQRLVALLSARISKSGAARVGVGFPGELDQGRVVRPGNLSRPSGVASRIDPELERQWVGFGLEEALSAMTGSDVRVVNDAALAALGCCRGEGIELVLTLGTGFGLALHVDGTRQRVRDVGVEVFHDAQTYDQALGERARAHSEGHWFETVVVALRELIDEFSPTTVYLAGGNARRLAPGAFSELGARVVIVGNEAPLRGAAHLF